MEWRCINCKAVIESPSEPDKCPECAQRHFVKIDTLHHPFAGTTFETRAERAARTRPTPDGEIGELGRGAMNCPICGLDTPHSHTETEIKHRPDQLAHRLARLATELRVGFYSAAHRTYETDYSRAAERALGIDLRLAADRLETQAADIARLREALGRARNGLASILPLGYPHPLIAEIDALLATRTDVR